MMTMESVVWFFGFVIAREIVALSVGVESVGSIYLLFIGGSERERVFVFECTLARRGVSWQHETFVIVIAFFVCDFNVVLMGKCDY